MKDDAFSETEQDDKSSQSPYAYANVRRVMAHYVVSRLLSGVAGVLIIILFVRHMEVIAYSRFATIVGIVGTVGILSSLGIEKAVTYFLPQGRIQQSSETLSRFIWRLLGLRTFVLIVVTAVLIGCWTFFSSDPAHPRRFVLPIALLIIGMNLFQFLSLVFQSLVQQKVLARILVIQWTGRLILLALALSYAPNVALQWALYIMALPDIVGSAVLCAALRHHLRTLRADAKTGGAHSAWPIWRDVRKLMWHNYGYSWLITPPQANSMIVVASLLLRVPEIAAYGFFVSIVERVRTYLPLQFMLNLAEPVLIAGYVRDRDFQELCRRSNLLYKPNFIFLMLFLALACAVSPVLTSALTGGKYIKYSFFLPLLIAQVTLGSHNTILQIIANSVGQSEILSKSGAVALACMSLFFFGCLVSGSANWPILISPLVFEMANIAVTIFLLRRSGFIYEWHPLFHLKVALAATLAFCVTYGLQDHARSTLQQVLSAGVTATLVFFAAGKLLRIATVEDVLAARRLLRSRQPSKG
jgi:O-antigen/teichoic acid export membrane protein